MKLNDLVEKLRKNPSRSCKKEIKGILDYDASRYKNFKRDLLSHFLLILFEFDYKACNLAITKCIVLNPSNYRITSSSERSKLVACLWFVITQTYDDDDYSEILDNIAKRALSDDGDLPFE